MDEQSYKLGSNRSAIRELFEYSKRRKAEIGEENVFDFSLGNPSVNPPKKVNETIIKILQEQNPCSVHGYTSAQGDAETRNAIADDLNKRYGTSYAGDMIYMTCGAASSLTISFKAIKDGDEDEILAIAPFFPEYKVFVEAVGEKFNYVEADLDKFEINFEDLEKKVNKNTKAIIIDSPNNPSGVIYQEESLKRLASFLNSKQKEYGHPIYIISDEPYREIAYDGRVVPHIPSLYDNTILCYSYSKNLSLPGERIGYVLVPPKCVESKKLYLTVCGAGRSMGYVCAPSLMQKMIAECASLVGDVSEYQRNRDALYSGLTKIGYECVYPAGAFYLFVKALEDSLSFSERAKQFDLIVVPSDGFGVKGYFRLAYCTKYETIINSMPKFQALFDSYKK